MAPIYANRQRKTDVFENAKAFAEGRPVRQMKLKHQKGGPVLAPLEEIVTEEHIRQISDLMADGFTLYAACGAIKLNPSLLAPAFAANPGFAEHLDIARLRRLHYLEDGLLHSRSPSMVAATMFALKNADPQAWQERPGPPVAVGISASITIITGVPEALPTAQAPKQIEAQATETDSLFFPEETPFGGMNNGQSGAERRERHRESPPDAHK